MRPWLALSVALLACSSDDPDPAPAKACTPGQQIECACPSSTTKGAQVCKADGSGYGVCDPCGIGGAGGGAGAGGAAPACKGKGDDCAAPGDVCCEGFRCSETNKICGF